MLKNNDINFVKKILKFENKKKVKNIFKNDDKNNLKKKEKDILNTEVKNTIIEKSDYMQIEYKKMFTKKDKNILKEPIPTNISKEPISNNISKEPISNNISKEPISNNISKEPIPTNISKETIPTNKNNFIKIEYIPKNEENDIVKIEDITNKKDTSKIKKKDNTQSIVNKENIKNDVVKKKDNTQSIVNEDNINDSVKLEEIKTIKKKEKNNLKNDSESSKSSNNVLKMPDYTNIYFGKQTKISFLKDNYYVLKFEGSVITSNLEYGIQFIEGVNDKQIIIYYYAENNLEIDEIEFIKMQKINYKINGYNPVILSNIDEEYLYYIYGILNDDKIVEILGLSNIFEYYTNDIINKKYNFDLLKRKWCYNLGKKGDKLDLLEFENFTNKYSYNIIKDKCLFFSKKIKGVGGNQKTALQIIDLLDKIYIIDVFSSNINNNYDFIKDSLDPKIHNMKILKKSNDKIIEDIKKNNYKFIINNKFNEYFNIFNKVKHPKLYVISHNSMDPFNKLIINNQNYIYKILTINRFHHTVLFHHGLRRQMGIFYNTIDEEEISVSKRDAFKKRICFIGRFSKEKNLELLLKCFNSINGIELVIIGSEIIDNYKKNKNIKWRGLLNKQEILKELYECDYLIVPSISEGLPFVILEAMNIGIPCIYSNIMGANELVKTNGDRGFTFELEGYKKCMMNINWDVFDEVYKYFNKNIKNITDAIIKAYSISIDDWNKMSEKCKKFVKKKYFAERTNKKNLETFEII